MAGMEKSLSFKGHEHSLNFFSSAHQTGMPYFLDGLWLDFPLRRFSVWVS